MIVVHKQHKKPLLQCFLRPVLEVAVPVPQGVLAAMVGPPVLVQGFAGTSETPPGGEGRDWWSLSPETLPLGFTTEGEKVKPLTPIEVEGE